jgi:drug/metabolite transporter (DMT)-like permease
MIRISKCLFVTVVFAIILYIGAFIQLEIQEYQRSNYRMVPLMLFVSFFPILIGMFLRVPGLVKELKQNKRWEIDWVKFFIIGIPTLYIALYPFFFSLGIPVVSVFLSNYLLGTQYVTTTIAGVVSGYILLGSLKGKS